MSGFLKRDRNHSPNSDQKNKGIEDRCLAGSHFWLIIFTSSKYNVCTKKSVLLELYSRQVQLKYGLWGLYCPSRPSKLKNFWIIRFHRHRNQPVNIYKSYAECSSLAFISCKGQFEITIFQGFLSYYCTNPEFWFILGVLGGQN